MTIRSYFQSAHMQYTFLRMRKLLGFKIFHVKICHISTKNQRIAIGMECQYKEGSTLEKAIIEDIYFRKNLVNLKIRFIETGRTFTCNSVLDGGGYGGMWRIYDKGHYDIEEWRREECE